MTTGDDDDPGAAAQATKIIAELAAEEDAKSKAVAKSEEDDATDEDDDETTDEGDDTTDEEGDGEGTDETADEGDEPKKKKPSRKDRYARQIERLQRENATLRSRQVPAGLSQAELSKRVGEIVGPAPREIDYAGDYLAFERAQIAFEVDTRQATREVKREAAQTKDQYVQSMRQKVDDHEERVEAYRKTVPDYDKVMAGASNIKVSPVVEELILDSQRSAALVYYFAKNPERLERMNRMTAIEAAREIGRIEESRRLPLTTRVKTESGAPRPRDKIKGRGTSGPRSQDAILDSYLDRTYGKGRRG
jgi:hypothetical protein